MTSLSIQRTQINGITPDGFLKLAASRHRRRTKRLRIRQKLAIHQRQTKFLAVFLGALAVLFVIARLIFLNSAQAQQFNNKNEISQGDPGPASVDENLKITEVTGS